MRSGTSQVPTNARMCYALNKCSKPSHPGLALTIVRSQHGRLRCSPRAKYVVYLIAVSQNFCERGSVMKTLASSLLIGSLMIASMTLGSLVGCSRPSNRLTHSLDAARRENYIDSSTRKPSPSIKWPVASGRQRREAPKAINSAIPPKATNGRAKGL
jgi:hypothetical protein